MNENKRIAIIQSAELARMRLSELVGREGLIVEDLIDRERRNIGYLVLLDNPFQGESLWYIPDDSISYE